MLVGIDEVGRGSLAGPLVVGLVSLNSKVPGLKDSKALTAIQRQHLSHQIYKAASCASLGWVWPHEIDELGLTLATKLAIIRSLNYRYISKAKFLIDGNYNYLAGLHQAETIIRGDESVAEISAASIIAKVARDNFMKSISQYFPGYGFHQNVGYGTKEHMMAIRTIGPCLQHRLSFSPLNAQQNTALVL